MLTRMFRIALLILITCLAMAFSPNANAVTLYYDLHNSVILMGPEVTSGIFSNPNNFTNHNLVSGNSAEIIDPGLSPLGLLPQGSEAYGSNDVVTNLNSMAPGSSRSIFTPVNPGPGPGLGNQGVIAQGNTTNTVPQEHGTAAHFCFRERPRQHRLPGLTPSTRHQSPCGRCIWIQPAPM